MDIEENDEVEREIDIVYSGQFCKDTKIFQFPLIPQNSMNTDNINSLNINQNQSSMKLEMKIEQKYLDKNNYNAVPIHTLKGEKVENNSNLCLGMMKNNKLILTPISQIFQFRHDFSDINKEKNMNIKIKKDIKQLGKKDDKEEKFTPLTIHQSDSINNKIILERMSSPEGELKKANFMSKNEYFYFLLKYVITPDCGGETNNDYFFSDKNNLSKESFPENINEERQEEKMIIEKENEKENKNAKKGRGFVSGLEAIKNISNTDKKSSKGESSNSIIYNMINKIFEENDCIYYDDLLDNISKQMNITKKDTEKINQIIKGIDESCLILKENICYLKDIQDSDINEVRNLLIKEIGNNDNGLKKQQIKKIIEKNGLSISDSKLTKLLQRLCRYSGNVWVIKTPSKEKES